MVNMKKVGATLLLAGTIGVVAAPAANAYSTGDCYERRTQILPYQTYVEEICYIDFNWAEEQLFPGFTDGERVMTTWMENGLGGRYNVQDTWWPGADKKP